MKTVSFALEQQSIFPIAAIKRLIMDSLYFLLQFYLGQRKYARLHLHRVAFTVPLCRGNAYSTFEFILRLTLKNFAAI